MMSTLHNSCGRIAQDARKMRSGCAVQMLMGGG